MRAIWSFVALAALLLSLVQAPITASATETSDNRSDSGRVPSDAVPDLIPTVDDRSSAERNVGVDQSNWVYTGRITGRILVTDGEEAIVPEQVQLRFWRWIEQAEVWSATTPISVTLDVDGNFDSPPRQPGTYRLEVRAIGFDAPAKGYWPTGASYWEGQQHTLGEGEPWDIGTMVLDASWPRFDRYEGSDRFATAVELSKAGFSDGSSPVVYVVNGLGFADALSAGPAAAARDGVLLLVTRDSIPAVVQAELHRLQPSKIVVVGGTAVVSSAVEAQLRGYVAASADVLRLQGENRYATSRAVVAHALLNGADGHTMFIATGRDYPDALAAGPAASYYDGLVMLVDGAASTVPQATYDVIANSDIGMVYLAGGSGTISDLVFEEMTRALYGPVQRFVDRIGGVDRYETATAINDHVFGWVGADKAYVATGLGFADALAGSTLAAANRAPIYLSRPRCLGLNEYISMVEIWAREVWLIGGPGALSDGVIHDDLC